MGFYSDGLPQFRAGVAHAEGVHQATVALALLVVLDELARADQADLWQQR